MKLQRNVPSHGILPLLSTVNQMQVFLNTRRSVKWRFNVWSYRWNSRTRGTCYTFIMNHSGKSNEVLVVSCSLDEADIEAQVSALREKLLANLNKMAINAKDLKPSDTHGIAAAKKEEMDRMARALGTRRDYTEGDAFNREKQEELKRKRAVDREERDRQREEERAGHCQEG